MTIHLDRKNISRYELYSSHDNRLKVKTIMFYVANTISIILIAKQMYRVLNSSTSDGSQTIKLLKT